MKKEINAIRRLLLFFMITLFLSGLTAMPAETELRFLVTHLPPGSALGDWLARVYDAVKQTNAHYPFIAYGYDWLAFAHFILALLFIGPYRDPVRNKWVIEFGMIACLLIIPFALIAGEARNIPLGWRLIDCCFGILGIIPIALVNNRICMLERRKIHPLQIEKSVT